MKNRTWRWGIGAAALAALAALPSYVYWQDHGRAWLCERSGGRWGSAVGLCIPRDCYAQGDCGYWSNPAARCSRLEAGDPIDKVYFQLGRPDRVDGARYIWGSRKGYGARAVIENGTLKALDCPVGPPGL